MSLEGCAAGFPPSIESNSIQCNAIPQVSLPSSEIHALRPCFTPKFWEEIHELCNAIPQVSLPSSEIHALRPCFTPKFWEEIHELRQHFDEERGKHGDGYTLAFREVKPYLNEVIYNEEEKKLFVSPLVHFYLLSFHAFLEFCAV